MARKEKKKLPDLPVGNDASRPLAPWPATDRYMIQLGTLLSMNYLIAAQRLAQSGYRQNWVDALNELLSKDAHAYCVLWQRISAVAGGKVAVSAAHVEHGTLEAERAEEIRKVIEQRIREIPGLQMALADLLWSLYYGIGCAEILWDRRPDGWHVTGLGFIHSRRLAYPDTARWDLRIWDQGAVQPGVQWAGGTWMWPTEQFFGIKISDFPGKFITFIPHVRGDYPTKDGLGYEIAPLMLMKLMAVRSEAYFIERFSKPFAFAYYSTKSKENDSLPRIADESDIKAAQEALKVLGVGSLTGATLPDSIKIELEGPAVGTGATAVKPGDFITFLNNEESKAVRGSTLTTDAGNKGARSLGEVHAEAELRNARYDAATLAESLKRDLVDWLVRLNFPGEEHLAPTIAIQVEERTPAEILDLVTKAVEAGMPLDADKVAAAATIAQLLIDPKNKEARRLAPVKPVDLGVLMPASQQAEDVRSALEALASAAGISLTNQTLNTLAEVGQERAAQFIEELLRATRQPSEEPRGSQESPAQTDETQPVQPTAKPARAKPKPPKRGATKTTPRQAAPQEA